MFFVIGNTHFDRVGLRIYQYTWPRFGSGSESAIRRIPLGATGSTYPYIIL